MDRKQDRPQTATFSEKREIDVRRYPVQVRATFIRLSRTGATQPTAA